MGLPRMTACLTALGLAVACSVAGCGTPGKSLQMINNTPVTVTMKSCPANAAQAQRCSAVSRIAPRGSADFPLSSPGGQAWLVVITGYDGQRCFTVPTNQLPEDVKAYVTDADPGSCIGPYGGPAPTP
jgi:hypothetical protein